MRKEKRALKRIFQSFDFEFQSFEFKFHRIGNSVSKFIIEKWKENSNVIVLFSFIIAVRSPENAEKAITRTGISTICMGVPLKAIHQR